VANEQILTRADRQLEADMAETPWAPSRRDFLKAAGLTVAQMNLLWSYALAEETPAKVPVKAKDGKSAPNILLIVNDQERYLDKLPPKYRLPGRERLQELGTEFTNHQNAEGTPWFLAVNFVNPHDVMYYNTDLPGERVQENGPMLCQLNREPLYGIYQQQWVSSCLSRAINPGTPTTAPAPISIIRRRDRASWEVFPTRISAGGV
jgi:hypothetical protein